MVPVTSVTSVPTFWVQAPHAFGFQGVVGAYLDLILKERVGETLEEKLIDRHVKSWDDFLKTTQLTPLIRSQIPQNFFHGNRTI